MKDSIYEKEFVRRYKGLNKSQKEAVDTIEGPVMVVAGPGTGKTTILTLRIANILRETDTPPSGILALTFTESGVKAMKSKLRELIGGRADEVRIHTFHGFASSVIAEFPEHFPHLSRSRQITDIEAGGIIREIIKEKKFLKLRPLGDPDFYISKIISSISEAKKEAFSPEDIRDFAKNEIEKIKMDPNSFSSRGKSMGELKAEALKRIDKCEKTILFAEVYGIYEKRKKEDFKIDFDDLLYELLLALKNDELLLRLLQEKFLYFLVDEHQDTNDSQNQIISYLASYFDKPNLFVVGDEKQAIYRFQGASVENFLKFQKLWDEMKVISLTENFRSHQSILDATFSMIEKNYQDGENEKLRIKLKSGADHKERPIDVVFAGNTNAGDEYLVKEIKEIQEKEKQAKIAVIVRWNRDVDYVLSVLSQSGLKASAERGVDIFSHPVGIAFFSILEYIENPGKLESLAITIASGLWGLSFEKRVETVKAIKSGDLKTVIKNIPVLQTLQNEISNSGVISYLTFVGEVSGLTSNERMSIPQNAEVWRGIIDLSRDIAESFRINDPLTLIKELLSYKKTAESKTVKIGSGDFECLLQVMTAHSSKGLEFDYVFTPFALEEYWLRRNRGTSFILPKERDEGDEVKDARRLFYVTLTRAKKHVVVISPLSDPLGKEYLPIRFIAELDNSSIKRIELNKLEMIPKSKKIEDLIVEREKELIDFSKRVLLQNGLSVTALNHFIKCPSEFLYKSILKVPEAPNPISEKGIAMHKAISFVWKDKDRSEKKIKNTLDSVVKGYFEVSLLSKNEKEIILDELLETNPIVAKALFEHFNTKADVLTDKWLEVEHEVSVLGKKVDINLHGQMDSILNSSDKTSIFDYKTREAMSENAIKGLTKDSDGGYFRQLIFYKILAEGSGYKNNIETSLVFIKPDAKGRCLTVTLSVTKEDENNVLLDVEKLVGSVFSGEFLSSTCDDPDCQYCRLRKLS